MVILVAGFSFAIGRGNFSHLLTKSSPTPAPSTASPKPSSLPSLPPADLSSVNMDVNTWQEQTIYPLGLIVKVPKGWISNTCPTGGGPTYCTTFGPPIDPNQNGGYSGPLMVVDIDPYVDKSDPARTKSPNYSIPAIGTSNNATLFSDAGGPRLIFKYAGVGQYYMFRLSPTGDQEGYDPQALKIMQQMVNSIRFTEVSDCTSPAVLPLKNFPSDFELINYHDSDGTDPVVKELSDNVATIKKGDNPRVFIVQYVKSGAAFNASSDFLSSVSLINPYSGWGDTNGTGIEAVNCSRLILPELETSGTSNFHLAKDTSDPFGIIVYGKGDNPAKLWGVAHWNTRLLQSTRNEVYIKQGNLAQRYTATTYSAYKSTCCLGGKPAIYLYPTKDSHVSVTINPQGSLLKADYLYQPGMYGWSVDVKKGGLISGNLPYLYYEVGLDVGQPEKGFVVPFESLFNFSRDYVKKLGLNDTEADEFIAFWKEKLPAAPYYFVSHLDKDTINQIYPLKIDPIPDVLLRVELYFKPLKEKIAVTEPVLPSVQLRSGFTAVEWGAILSH